LLQVPFAALQHKQIISDVRYAAPAPSLASSRPYRQGSHPGWPTQNLSQPDPAYSRFVV
jgi:hypothetical protein